MALFDALGRANYQRLLAPAVLSAVAEGVKLAKGKDGAGSGDYYNLFDFTRYYVIAQDSRRNYKAIYSGHIPGLFEGLRTGVTRTISSDPYNCQVEAEEVQRAERERNAAQLERALQRLAQRCRTTLWGGFRDQGYLTGNAGVDSLSLGEYFNVCRDTCANASYTSRWTNATTAATATTGSNTLVKGLGPLLSIDTSDVLGRWNGARTTLPALAASFHSFALPGGPPIFATEQSLDSHNVLQEVGSLAYMMKGLIGVLQKSAKARGVPLPLLVMHADHGAHYGQIHTTRAGRFEHKVGMLLLLVPETMLKNGLRERLERNRKRLISAFDVHHTLLQFAKRSRQEGEEGEVGREGEEDEKDEKDDNDLEAVRGMERIDFFQDVVPEERSCHNAGIEKHLCYCDAWVPCDATSLPAVEHQAKNVVIPLLNDRLSKMLNKEQKSLTKHCGKAFQFASIDSAETSTQPASLHFILTAKVGTKDVLFSVSLTCDDTAFRLLRFLKQKDRFVPKKSSVCRVSALSRMTSMSKREDAVYKAAGKTSSGGKLCVVP